jgi:DNA-binding Lrp family transcriptional regulator
MELKQILEEVPGLTRRFVHYLEARGYIHPEKIQKQRIARREYSEQDLEVVRNIWRYYSRGYALQAAYDLATQTQRTITYLGVRTPFRKSAEVVEQLREQSQIMEAGVVHGADIDLILKTDTPDQSEVYHILVPILAELGITGLPDVYVTENRFIERAALRKSGEFRGMMAYVLMKVPGKDVSKVMELLKAFDAIKEASTIYGESDVVLKVETADQEELDNLVMKRLHDIPAVESTRTFVVVKDLYWSR